MSHLTVVKFMEHNAENNLPGNSSDSLPVDPGPIAARPAAELATPAETGTSGLETGSKLYEPSVNEPNVYGSEQAWNPLDIRHVRLEQVTGMIVWIVLLIGGLVGFGIWYFVSGVDRIWLLSFCGLAVMAGLLLWSTLYWPVIAHRHARWRLDETGLEIRRGVFWKHQLSVPLARLQHADIGQGPFQRRFGIAKLTVHTAGTANASIELDGLAIETATWLRDMLIRQKEAQDVV